MRPLSGPVAGEGAAERPQLTVALVNNMPDAALQATERQFAGLLAEAAGDAFDVRLRLYALEGVPRGELARAAMAESYGGLDALKAVGADAVIVTGAEPQAAHLSQEPYWDELCALIDWSRTGVASALFSCLAAHAAVLRLDGIERRRSPAKTSGVFAFQRCADAALARGLGEAWRTPHSRWNAVEARDLAACGYQVLAAGPEAGVDLFARQQESLFVFLQGHPEYAADSLLREYRRDLGRVLRGEQPRAPRPRGYFDAETEARLDAAEGPGACDRIAAGFRPDALWRGHAVRLFRNWLERVAELRRAPAAALAAPAAG